VTDVLYKFIKLQRFCIDDVVYGGLQPTNQFSGRALQRRSASMQCWQSVVSWVLGRQSVCRVSQLRSVERTVNM